jgi:RHS repeat-associated protein
VLEARCSTTGTTPWEVCFRSADHHKVPIDPNGNLTSKVEGSDVWAYTWNAENQLTKVEKDAVEQARFAYDPRGRRVEKVAAGVTTGYTYDETEVVREIRGSTTLKYIHGPAIDEPLATDDGTALSYFHADGLGSIVRTTNATGAVAFTRRYDAWGNLELGASEPGYAFTGREWAPETGLYYYRARYYDPRLGRFLSEDPIRFGAGPNFYAYVENNPVDNADPWGLFCVPTGRTKSWKSMSIKHHNWAFAHFQEVQFQNGTAAGTCTFARATTIITYTNKMVEELCFTVSKCSGVPGAYRRWTAGGRTESQKAGPDDLFQSPAYYLHTEYWCRDPSLNWFRVPQGRT